MKDRKREGRRERGKDRKREGRKRESERKIEGEKERKR